MAGKRARKGFIMIIVMVICAATMLIMSGCGAEEEVVTYTNPLTGKITETEVDTPRPLVVSIDNVNEAIPQSWLSKADLVYEFPVEGEQTRLQAVYYTEFPEHFGPIRSTRPYFVDLAREYKAVFLAHGWSPEARDYLFSGVVPYINAMNSSLDFYRVDDKPAPHNSYIKWETVKEEIEAQGWWDEKKKVKAFKFIKEGAESAGERVDKVEFSYNGSDCEFTYDAESNKYVRTVDGAEYIDHETGKPIKVSNVLVQMVRSVEVDSKGRLRIDMCAGGDALLFTNGKVVKGTWSREDLDSRTIFVDAEGNQFRLSRGKSWVEVTDQNCDIDYVIIPEETEEGEDE